MTDAMTLERLAGMGIRVRALKWEYHDARGTWTASGSLVEYDVSDSQWVCNKSAGAWQWVEGGDEAAKAAAQADYEARILAALTAPPSNHAQMTDEAATLAAMTPTMQANFHRMMGQRGVLKKLAKGQVE